MNHWQVIVSNVGTVLSTENGADALRWYGNYCLMSKQGYGKASGESVTLLKNDAVHFEYIGESEN